MTALPQIGAQSGSRVKLAPSPRAQQPSPGRSDVIGRYTQAAAHVPALTRRSSVQMFASAQDRGQADGFPTGSAMSQTSPSVVWMAKSPHRLEQSPSFAEVQPGGQQPSFTS